MGANFVVQLENRPGALAGLARAFADAGVNIGEVSGGGTGEYCYAIVTTEDARAAHDVLRAGGYVYQAGETLIVDVPDRTGGLAEVAGKLEAAGVNIEAILFLGRKEGAVETALTVDDVEAARRALA